MGFLNEGPNCLSIEVYRPSGGGSEEETSDRLGSSVTAII